LSSDVGGATGDVAVKAQVFAASGAPVGSEILVNTTTSDDHYPNKITALSNGGFVVTWTDASQGLDVRPECSRPAAPWTATRF